MTQWTVNFTRKAEKQAHKLSQSAFAALRLLVIDLECKGPVSGKGWQNYAKFKGVAKRDCRHCHLIKGNPTYVCCWEVVNRNIKIIKVYYAGTHEKAPY